MRETERESESERVRVRVRVRVRYRLNDQVLWIRFTFNIFIGC